MGIGEISRMSRIRGIGRLLGEGFIVCLGEGELIGTGEGMDRKERGVLEENQLTD